MPVSAPATLPEPTLYRFSVRDYHQMGKAGVLEPDLNVELLNGHIYEMAPIGSQHAACVDRLNRLFMRAVADRAIVRVQNPIVLPPDSEPEPNVALLKPRDDDYASRHPRPEDVLLVIEVADASLSFDQEVKVPLYAQAGIPEVWVVALDEDRVHAYQMPTSGSYREHTIYERGDEMTLPLKAARTVLAVDDVLGT
jgi:Uma2 family endonuclease